MGMESEEESEDEEGGQEEVVSGRGRNGIMGVLWVVLSVVGTLGGRRMLRGGFGEFDPDDWGGHVLIFCDRIS